MEEDGYKVTLHAYDLSGGLARQLSTSFLGKAIEAIWHTGVVVYGTEYSFGGGIQQVPAGTTQYGTPLRVIDLGVTHIPKDVFEMYLQEISPRYTAETYSLLTHNCNNFSNEIAQFLVGASVPEYILNLPNEVMSIPMGALIMPMIQKLETIMRACAVPQAPQFIKPTPVPSIPQASKKPATSSKSLEKPKPENVGPPGPTSQPKPVVDDPLGDARSKVQEEIGKEIAAIMASGTLPASEALELATRKVMQKYGFLQWRIQDWKLIISSPVIPQPSKKPATSSKSLEKPKPENVGPPAVAPAGPTSQPKPVVDDPLGDARSKVQEEIGKEFAAIMASGTLPASEALELATRKVMQKYGFLHWRIQDWKLIISSPVIPVLKIRNRYHANTKDGVPMSLCQNPKKRVKNFR